MNRGNTGYVLHLLLTASMVAFGCSGASERAEREDSEPAASPAANASGEEVLFQDDFSDPASGWQRETEDYQTTDYQDGAYVIRFEDTNLITRVAYPGEDIENGTVEVDGTVPEGGSGDYGVYARYTGDGFLRCVVNTEGEAALQVARYEGYGVPSPTFEPNSAVQKGKNRIALHFAGKDVTCSVNGVEIGTVEDPAPQAGALGLVASNDEEAFQVQFANFLLTRP